MGIREATLPARPRPGPRGSPPGASAASPFLLPFDAGMPPEVLALGTTRCFGRGEFVYQQGQESSEFFVVVSGRVRIFMALADGTERVLCFVEPGASFGESACFDGLPYYVSSVAVVRSEIRVIGRDAVLALLHDRPRVLLALTYALSRKARLIGMHLAMTGMTAGDRAVVLLDHLLRAYGAPGSGGHRTRLLTRHSVEELARMVGVTRATMSRELSRLVSAGVLARDGWDLVILDPDAIEERARRALG